MMIRQGHHGDVPGTLANLSLVCSSIGAASEAMLHSAVEQSLLTVVAMETDLPQALAVFSTVPSPSLRHWEAHYLRSFDFPSDILPSLTPNRTVFLQAFFASDHITEVDFFNVLKFAFDALPDASLCLASKPRADTAHDDDCVDFDSSSPLPHVMDIHGLIDVPPCAHHQDDNDDDDGIDDNSSQPLAASISPLVLVCIERRHVSPDLRVRRARVEDHDDLMDIFERQSEVLQSTFGEFFLANLIDEADGENTLALVVEYHRHAVGFLSLTNDVNMNSLRSAFHLEPFQDSPQDSPSTSVIAVQLFCIAPEHSGRSVDLLDTALTDPQYALSASASLVILSLPHTAHISACALSRYFTRVPLRTHTPTHHATCMSSSHQLYALHRRSLLERHHLSVRPLVDSDLTHLQSLFNTHHPNNDKLQEEITEALKLSERAVRGTARIPGPSGTRIDAYAILSNSASAHAPPAPALLIGALLLADCSPAEAQRLRARYDIEDYVMWEHSSGHATIVHILLSPLFSAQLSRVLTLLMRYTGHTCLYHRTSNVSTHTHSQKPPNLSHTDTLTRLHALPIRPRRQIVYPSPHEGRRNMPLSSEDPHTPQENTFHLRLMSPHTLAQPRIHINNRIVLVGASDTTLALLRSLVYHPMLLFTHLTLVAPVHSPFLHPINLPPFRTLSHCFTAQQLAQLSLGSFVAHFNSSLVAIDRRRQRVLLSSNDSLPFDLLVLATGLQYTCERGTSKTATTTTYKAQHIFTVNTDADRLALHTHLFETFLHPRPILATGVVRSPACISPSAVPLLHGLSPLLPVRIPSSASVVSGTVSTTIRSDSASPHVDGAVPGTVLSPPPLTELQVQQLRDAVRPIVVLGDTLDAVCCVQSILSMGIAPSKVVLVLSHQPTKGTPPWTRFSTSAFYNRVCVSLKAKGVTIVGPTDATVFALLPDDRPLYSDHKLLGTVELSDGTRLACSTLVCLAHRTVDSHIVRAANDASLVFDHRLVVDPWSFCTNDPLVLAAGPLTKFPRRLRAGDTGAHGLASSVEVGERLADCLIARVLNASTSDFSISTSTVTPPEYTCGKAMGGTLPDAQEFLLVRTPQPIAAHKARTLTTETSDVEDTTLSALCSIHLDGNGLIEGLTCTRTTPLPVANLLALIGLPERLLNRLVDRFDERLIPDLYTHLSSTPVLAIFHDRFPTLLREIRDTRNTNADANESISTGESLSAAQHAELRRFYAHSQQASAADRLLFGFLNYNAYHLPFVYCPEMKKLI